MTKKLSRKDFLKFMGMAGVSATVPFSMNFISSGSYTGKLFVLIHAGGGWDPSSLTDPKGTANGINKFNSFVSQSGFTFAPNLINNAFDSSTNSLSYKFLSELGSRLLVINGIDTETNNHGVGPRYVWSGRLPTGNPTFGALQAAACAPNLPLAFISNGGYQITEGIIAPSRISNSSLIETISAPNTYNSNKIFTDATFARIRSYRDNRHAAKYAEQQLPVIKNAMQTLTDARIGEQDLKNFVSFINTMDNGPNNLTAIRAAIDPAVGTNNSVINRYMNLIQQFRIGYAAYQAGICSAINLSLGGFDTHSNHDNLHFPLMAALLDAIRKMVSITTTTDLSQLFVAVGSDFGRTPKYNGGNGKDHWPITSMMFLAEGTNFRTGIIGATDSAQKARKVRAADLVVDDVTGSTIKPSHIQRAMRRYARIETTAPASKFPVPVASNEVNFDSLIDPT